MGEKAERGGIRRGTRVVLGSWSRRAEGGRAVTEPRSGNGVGKSQRSQTRAEVRRSEHQRKASRERGLQGFRLILEDSVAGRVQDTQLSWCLPHCSPYFVGQDS